MLLFVDAVDVALPALEVDGLDPLLADVEFVCENADVVTDATNIVLNIITVKIIARLIFVLLLLINLN